MKVLGATLLLLSDWLVDPADRQKNERIKPKKRHKDGNISQFKPYYHSMSLQLISEEYLIVLICLRLFSFVFSALLC